MKIINIGFDINKEEKISNSESRLEWTNSKESNINRGLFISNQIDNLLQNQTKQTHSLSQKLELLYKFINDNKFYKFNILALKKGTKKFKNWIQDENDLKEIENVVLICYSTNKELKNNTICFFYKIRKKRDKLSLYDLYLSRIEFFNWNLDEDDLKEEIKICNYKDLEQEDKKQLINYENIFDDDDFNGEDPIKFREWQEFIKKIKGLYKNDKNTDEKDNFVIKLNNQTNKFILLSKIDLNISSNNTKFNLYDNSSGDYVFKNEDLQSKIMWKQSNISWSTQLNESKNKNNKEIEQIKEDLNILKNNKETEISRIKAEKELLNEYENQLNDYQAKIESLEQELDKLTKNKQKQRNKEIDNEEIALKQEKTQDIKKNINDCKTQEDNIKKKIEEKGTLIQNLDNEKKKIEKDVQSKKDDEIRLENQNLKIDRLLSWIQDNDLTNQYEISPKNEEFFDEKSFSSFEDILKNSNDDLDINNLEALSFIDDDKGTKAIIDRFDWAIKNVECGYYKNPLFYFGIKKPNSKETHIRKHNELDSNIKEKYHLNKKQESAVTKAINTNSIFYLQGPPGTGKTQTIAAITEYLVKNNQKIVMTSSTHEAINNFFDRLNDYNLQNPNLVMLKWRNTTDEKNKDNFSENTLFKKFKERMLNNVVTKNNKNDILTKINNYKIKYRTDLPEKYLKFLPRPIVEFIFNDFKNNSQYFKIEKDQLIDPVGYENEMTNGIKKRLQDKKNNHNEQDKEFIEIIKQIFSNINNLNIKLNQIDFNKNYLDTLFEQILNNNKDVDNSLFNKIVEKYKDKNDLYENKFLDYILEKQLINVIGITTTSKNSIKVNNKETSLYSEYPIDYMIIDEISKCAMPEILSKAIVAKKIIFAGDYLQLPPQSNLSTDKIIDHLIKIENNENIQTIQENKEEYKKFKRAQQDKIDNLFKQSFFTEMVKQIKNNKNTEHKPYEFLNESHRFGKEILNIVNVIYPEDEKLKMPTNDKFKTIQYNLNIEGQLLSNPCCLINLLSPSQDFLNDHDEFKQIKTTNKGFDQTGKTFSFKNHKIKNNSDALFNQWSAYVVTHIIEKVIEQNKEKFNNSNIKIAVVTLTKAQKQIMNEYIHNDIDIKQYKPYIKVDTIDNFQGREEEIVVVDFIRGYKKIESTKIIQITGKRNLTFLESKERINVALSRAKQKLVIVGQFEYLKNQNTLFRTYINQLQESNDSYVEIGENHE